MSTLIDWIEQWALHGPSNNIPLNILEQIHDKFFRWIFARIMQISYLDLKNYEASTSNSPRRLNEVKKNFIAAYEYFQSELCRSYCRSINIPYDNVLKKIKPYEQIYKELTNENTSNNLPL